MVPRLIACDVDGTLTRRDGTVGPGTIAALARAREEGIHVALATGRPVELFGMITDQMPGVFGHVVAANGALVAQLDPFDVIHSVEISRRDVETLVEGFRAGLAGVRFALAVEGRLIWEPGLETRLPVPPPGDPVPDALAALDVEQCRKILAFHPDHDVRALIGLLHPLAGDGFTVGHVGADAAEIAPTGIDKAFGLAVLCDHLGCGPADVVVFGDNMNDWSMFAWAGHAVAVANADPETRSRADEVTASSDDDGVGLVVERLLEQR